MDPAVSWPLSFCLIGDNPVLAREFSALLCNCGFVPNSDGSVPITIKLCPAGELSTTQRHGEPIIEWRGLSIRKQAERILFSYRSWDLELDLSTLVFRCSGPDPDPTELLNFREFFLLTGLLFMMHRLGGFELHAAACVHKESGYLLLGPSGSGKTSAVISLIASGWSYVSDDAVMVCASPESSLTVRALRRSFSLKADYLQRHPELNGYATEPVPGTQKRRLDPRQIWPKQYLPMAHPKIIVSCKLADDETSRIVPISQAESLACLVGSTPWLMFDQSMAPAQLEVFRSLATGCRNFELSAGRELFRNGNRLASLLAPEALT